MSIKLYLNIFKALLTLPLRSERLFRRTFNTLDYLIPQLNVGGQSLKAQVTPQKPVVLGFLFQYLKTLTLTF